MANSTHTPRSRTQLAPGHRTIAIALVGLALCGWSAVTARADGDPASDVLATQPLFLPADAGLSAAQAERLAELLATAGRRGYRIRVAIVASAADLGSVTELWRKPRLYAEFLGQELALTYRGPLLVIMPDGFGLYERGKPIGAAQSVLATVPAPSPGGGALATAAVAAVRGLAATAGLVLPLPSPTTQPAARPTSATTWAAFAIGAALILAAWSASLRARPLRGHSVP